MMPTGSHLCMTTKKAVIVIHGYYFSVKEFGHNVFVMDILICFISKYLKLSVGGRVSMTSWPLNHAV